MRRSLRRRTRSEKVGDGRWGIELGDGDGGWEIGDGKWRTEGVRRSRPEDEVGRGGRWQMGGKRWGIELGDGDRG